MSGKAGSVRSIYIQYQMRDNVTRPLAQTNHLVDQSRNKARLAAGGFTTARQSIAKYAAVGAAGIKNLSSTLEKHRLVLLGVGAALVANVGLALKGAINEEKYRMNVKSLSDVIKTSGENQEDVNAALQEYITAAGTRNYISKETRAQMVSELALMGATRQTILQYGETLERVGPATGKSTVDVIQAVRSAMYGQTRALKQYADVSEEEIKRQMVVVRQQHADWNEQAIRTEATLAIAYPKMIKKIGDFDMAMDSAYGTTVVFKEKLSDLMGDIGAVYIPTFRAVVGALTGVVNVIRSHPILSYAIAWGTLGGVALTFGGLILPKVILALQWWKTLTIWHTIAQSKLAATILSRIIPAQVAQAYSTGGLTAALYTGAAAGWAFVAPWLPWIAIGAAAITTGYLLYDLFNKGWEDSALKWVVNWLNENVPWLTDTFTGLVHIIETFWQWITAIPDAVMSAWQTIVDHPLFKIAETVFRFTPMGMAFTAAEMGASAANEIFASTAPIASTTHTSRTHVATIESRPTINVHMDGRGGRMSKHEEDMITKLIAKGVTQANKAQERKIERQLGAVGY